MSEFSVKVDGSTVEFDVLVQPKASRNACVGLHDGRLKIRITAPPVDGKANAAVKKFLAKTLGISKSQVIIVSGASGRRKRIRLIADPVDAIVYALEHLVG
jgi:uncharacterized protein (TIGR00251 family)